MTDLRVLLQIGRIAKVVNGNYYIIGPNSLLRKDWQLTSKRFNSILQLPGSPNYNITHIYECSLYHKKLIAFLQENPGVFELPVELYDIYDDIIYRIQSKSESITIIYPDYKNRINIF